jgi:hypothetical protein
MGEYPGTKKFGRIMFPVVVAMVGLFMVVDGSHPYVGPIFVIGGGLLLVFQFVKSGGSEGARN